MADIRIVPNAEGAWIALIIGVLVVVLLTLWTMSERSRTDPIPARPVEAPGATAGETPR